MSSRTLLRATVVSALATCAAAHVPLVHPGNGNALHWGRPYDVSIVINASGSEDIQDGSHVTALRNAIDAWNAIGGMTLQLEENRSSTQQSRTDWASDSIHLILFDEDDSSGYFPDGTGIVALTPVYFASSGAILDADVLFNGSEFQFATRPSALRFDVQDVATHELGHFVGLDHSGWAGSTLYPYVDPLVLLHRSPSQDEICGLRGTYPAAAFAALRGTLRRTSNDTIVRGAQVVALDADGRTRASALSNSTGGFSLIGLLAGGYTLYATPLDGPVSEGNLGSGHTIETDFASTTLGSWSVAAGEDRSLPTQHVDPDVALALGRNNDEFPLRAIAGQTRSFSLRGVGLVNGCTLSASDPALLVDVTAWNGTMVSFQVTTPIDSPPGHADLAVENPVGARSFLSGALEITPRDPLLASVDPAQGTKHGGTQLTIHGARFVPGSRVVLGTQIYVDGAADGCTVVDSTTITLTTLSTPAGDADVVVIDPSGDEARLVAGFRFEALPQIATLFPAAGSAGGGTLLTLTGADFEPGCTVSIDGVAQASVEYVDSTLLRVTTGAYVAGGPYTLDVVNPLGASASTAFAYALDPDPLVTGLDPAIGSASGGDEITIHGANFFASTNVWFGADAETGLGGTPAAEITFVDANTLIVVTPAVSSGVRDLVVRDDITGQAMALAGAFTFTSSGGSGGCSIAPLAPPSGPAERLAGGMWLALVLVVLSLRTRRLRRRAA